MGKIYEDFLQYLSEVKMLRSFYMQRNEIEFDNESDSDSSNESNGKSKEGEGE